MARRSWRQQIYPVLAWPAVRRHGNGAAPTSELTQIEPRLGAAGYLAPAPARAWVAMQWACWIDTRMKLTLTGASRTLPMQEALFKDRHESPPR